jgi:Domain of unknown function (DUF4878)
MNRIALGLTLALAMAACSRGSSTPEGAVQEFVLAVQSGRCDGLSDYLASNSRATLGPKFETACRSGKMKNEGGKQLASFKTIDKQENGDRATVRLQEQFSDGTTGDTNSFVMVREDGRWRLDLFATGMAGRQGGAGGVPTGPVAPPTPTPDVTMPPTPTPDAAPKAQGGETNTTTTTSNSSTATDEAQPDKH